MADKMASRVSLNQHYGAHRLAPVGAFFLPRQSPAEGDRMRLKNSHYIVILFLDTNTRGW